MLQLWSKKMLSTLYYTFKIIPTPADAVVTINGEATNSVTLIDGSEITWSVEADGYAKQSGTVVLSEDVVMDIVLEEQNDPLYACYHVSDSIVGTLYYYAKFPFGVDLSVYGDVDNYCVVKASSSSQLKKFLSGATWVNISEDSGKTSFGKSGKRYRDDDLYE